MPSHHSVGEGCCQQGSTDLRGYSQEYVRLHLGCARQACIFPVGRGIHVLSLCIQTHLFLHCRLACGHLLSWATCNTEGSEAGESLAARSSCVEQVSFQDSSSRHRPTRRPTGLQVLLASSQSSNLYTYKHLAPVSQCCRTRRGPHRSLYGTHLEPGFTAGQQ